MKKIRYFARAFILRTTLVNIIALVCISSAYGADLNSHQQGLIEGALTYHPNLAIAQVQVEVDKGKAQLRGIVDSQLSKALAEELAISVRGIRAVSNQLRIAPDYFVKRREIESKGEGTHQRLSNVTISNKVKSQLLANRVTSGMDVEIGTHNRVVTIQGQVHSEAERALAYWIVKNTQGVTTVINNLDIRSHQQQAMVQVTEQ